jgi:hypothetical protein
MLVVPALNPVSIPAALIVATAGAPELQLPPGVASVSEMVLLSQTLPGPDMLAGNAVTLMVCSV